MCYYHPLCVPVPLCSGSSTDIPTTPQTSGTPSLETFTGRTPLLTLRLCVLCLPHPTPLHMGTEYMCLGLCSATYSSYLPAVPVLPAYPHHRSHSVYIVVQTYLCLCGVQYFAHLCLFFPPMQPSETTLCHHVCVTIGEHLTLLFVSVPCCEDWWTGRTCSLLPWPVRTPTPNHYPLPVDSCYLPMTLRLRHDYTCLALPSIVSCAL